MSEKIQVKAPEKNYENITQGTKYNSISEPGLYKVKETFEQGDSKEALFSINFPASEESNLSQENIGEVNNLKDQTKILMKGLSLIPVLLMLALIGLLTEWILYLKGN